MPGYEFSLSLVSPYYTGEYESEKTCVLAYFVIKCATVNVPNNVFSRSIKEFMRNIASSFLLALDKFAM